MVQRILWNTFRLGCWLLAWAAIIYAAAFLPRAAAGLIECGISHPKFGLRLFATVLIGLGCVTGVLVMVHVTRVEIVIPLLRRFMGRGPTKDVSNELNPRSGP